MGNLRVVEFCKKITVGDVLIKNICILKSVL